jgi:hypothetical protein
VEELLSLMRRKHSMLKTKVGVAVPRWKIATGIIYPFLHKSEIKLQVCAGRSVG